MWILKAAHLGCRVPGEEHGCQDRCIAPTPEPSVAPIFSHLVLKHTLEDYPSSTPFPLLITYPTLHSVDPWALNLLLLTAQALPNAGGTAGPQLFILFCQIPGPGLTRPQEGTSRRGCQRWGRAGV